MELEVFMRNLRALMRRNGKLLGTQSREAGLGGGALGYWERGTVPRVDNLILYMNYTGISPNELFGYEPPRKPEAGKKMRLAKATAPVEVRPPRGEAAELFEPPPKPSKPAEKAAPAHPKPDTSRCRTCRYRAYVNINKARKNYACQYILLTGQKRPCKPGKDCTAYEPLDAKEGETDE